MAIDTKIHTGRAVWYWILTALVVLELGAAALLAPDMPLLKEWAYAGVFFVYSGAIVAHVSTDRSLSSVLMLSVLLAAVVVSWALRPASRRLDRSVV